MKKRRISGVKGSSIQKMVTDDLLPVAGGYIGATVVDTLLGKIAPKATQYSQWAKLGLGAVLGVTQKGMLSKVGLGIAVAGVTDIAGDILKKDTVGLFPAGRPSYLVAGVADEATSDALKVAEYA